MGEKLFLPMIESPALACLQSAHYFDSYHEDKERQGLTMIIGNASTSCSGIAMIALDMLFSFYSLNGGILIMNLLTYNIILFLSMLILELQRSALEPKGNAGKSAIDER
ncbi:hypothetical protein AABB24_018639 [Solanum stoloniferum]|uniref:Uncharacterized protein n=1 Tax=Solanum stoloniferum TaxID=62892 RepID=A0ABD2TCN4_9SOLN